MNTCVQLIKVMLRQGVALAQQEKGCSIKFMGIFYSLLYVPMYNMHKRKICKRKNMPKEKLKQKESKGFEI